MKRTVPLFITAIAGFVLIISFFLPAIQEWGEVAAVWFDILASIAFVLGGGNLLKLHLKAISDGDEGWGYSAVTIAAFLLTLAFGLLKLGSPPKSNVEFYGETFVSYPLEAMPVYRIAGSIPERADKEPLPASVRRQLREENGELVFTGWMSRGQKKDLQEYQQTLAWQCKVDELFQVTQPENLTGDVHYYPNHSALAVAGPLTTEHQTTLGNLLPAGEVSQRAIAELAELSNRVSNFELKHSPATLSIPDEFDQEIKLSGSNLTVVGPLQPVLRDRLTGAWADFPAAMPLTPEEQTEFLNQLQADGDKLTSEQQEVLSKHFAAQWNAPLLIAAMNTAGVPPKVEKTACELLEEQVNGVEELVLTKPTGETKELNKAQENLIDQFLQSSERDVVQLKTDLSQAGEITDAQLSAIDQFLNSLPRMAEEHKAIGLKLLAAGPLTKGQQELLFRRAVDLYKWQSEVNQIFSATHQVKYPWSGDYTAQGNLFWWTYEYVLQPLMTTTFAVLAFYVASAAFRAFRAKNLEATLLLGTAFIVLLGRTYLGVQLTAWVPDALSALKIDQMIVYIMKIFNTAGNRAIMIGIALGIASTSLKVLLGIDRSYLGSSDE